MNEESQCTWTKIRKGPRAFLSGALIVFIAAFLFAAGLTTLSLCTAPEFVYEWADGYGYSVWQIPGLVPALIGLKVMALFIVAVATACFLYRGFHHLLRPAAIGVRNTTENQQNVNGPDNPPLP
jgi:hypothetical protein